MTIHEIAVQLHNLSVGGYFNGEKFTVTRLENQIRHQIRGMSVDESLMMEIALPDGWWWFTINRYGKKSDQYDYYIPETREDEKSLCNRFNWQWGGHEHGLNPY